MIEQLEAARLSLADEWRTQNPQTESAVADFYRFAVGQIADLDAWHETESRQLWTKVLVGAVAASGAHRVLDVGAGLGHDLKALRAAYPELELWAVEPNDTQAAVISAELHIPVLPELDASLIGGGFDLIQCVDVFEHVPNPDRLLAQIIGFLHRLGSIFVEATGTTDVDTPLHLEANRGWSPGRLLDRHGFELVEQAGRLRVWRRVRSSRGAEPTALVCAYRSLSVQTADAIARLTQLGWRRSFHRGDALVSRVRSIALSRWLREEDGDVALMFDDDIVFTPEQAERVVDLARRTESIASGAYPVRGGSHLASRLLDGASNVQFGPELSPLEIQWAGTGFMAIHRKVAEAVAATLPLCHADADWSFWPMFWETLYQGPNGVTEFLSEDWAFCERARELGFKIWLDPTIFLTHIGEMGYTVDGMQDAIWNEPPGTDGGG